MTQAANLAALGSNTNSSGTLQPSGGGSGLTNGAPSFLFTRSSSYWVSNNTTQTKVSLDTVIYDNYNGCNTSTNTYTVPVTGRYFVEWVVSFTGFANSQNFLNAALYKNGSFYADALQNNMTANSGTYTSCGSGLVLSLTAGDTLSLYQNYQQGGVLLNHDGYRIKLTGFYIG